MPPTKDRKMCKVWALIYRWDIIAACIGTDIEKSEIIPIV